jgi:hypothetical protein
MPKINEIYFHISWTDPINNNPSNGQNSKIDIIFDIFGIFWWFYGAHGKLDGALC